MKKAFQIIIVFILLFSFFNSSLCAQEQKDYFKIQVIDKETRRGVPLVELKTTNSILYYTDNNGVIAFYEDGFMDQQVFFYIKSHGYDYPSDSFGFKGKTIPVKKGGSIVIELERINIAERLYRITGQGQYHHSLLVGHPIPVKYPMINAKVTGQDTFVETLYKGKIYWFWGDTDNPSYPLGEFSTTGAWSNLPGKGGLDPAVGINLTYFVDSDGLSKAMCPISGPGPVWIHWLVNIADEQGIEHLFASYTRIKTLEEAYERGIALFNDTLEIFEPLVQFDLDDPIFPDGHPLRLEVDGVEYLYFSFTPPYAIRVRADLEHIIDPDAYEAFTCLSAGNRYEKSAPKPDRGPNGHLRYSWKSNTEPFNYRQKEELIEAGLMRPEESWLQLQDIEGGTPIVSHAGSICWNEYRKRWIMIFHEKGGTSLLGEVWYTEGDTPMGPWTYARKIVTHDRYSFYNVGQHPLFDQEGGRLIYFEGTYTNSFSETPVKTPRYNYNQIMYRLDLNDPRLFLPVPVYYLGNTVGQASYQIRESIDSLNAWNKIENIPFFAIPADRAFDGLLAVFQEEEKGKSRLKVKAAGNKTFEKNPIFYGLPLEEPTEEKFFGTWNCKADDYPLQMNIEKDVNKMNVFFNEETLVVRKVNSVRDTIVINVEDIEEKLVYTISAYLQKGKMIGKVVERKTNETLKWEGERIAKRNKLYRSKAVLPLYEYLNEKGEFYYSTDSGIPNMKQSIKPICLVWKNPSSAFRFDFNAKPIPLPKQ